MTTLVNFTPSTTAAFGFTPVLNGTAYNAFVTWNVFGQRFYLNLTDSNNNLVLCTAVVPSGPRYWATVYFDDDQSVAVVTTTVPHFVPIGCMAQLRFSGTGLNFDGIWRMYATTETTLTYVQPQSPPNPVVIQMPTADDSLAPPTQFPGALDAPLNLVAGIVTGGFLCFWDDSQQFEYV